ncbi:hypothetical protein CVT26_005518 [Gymnopilus dilepis]|uniref:Uncharacterized protein n=1 Tax=Gymnopilus dilepis TaxID=231916 RepID=A0A409W837_9AGAR|nr:hypothetical protein CVT26_005518 [Gymnopilus dilepis]
MKEIWNVRSFYRRLFYSETAVVKLLAQGDIMFYGPLVFKFFDKTMEGHAWDISDPLDICVHVQALDKIIDFMSQEAFMFNSYTTISFRETVNRELANTKSWKLKSSGERNASQEDHSAWGPYEFGRLVHRHRYQRARIHVVRCEPYQHVLSLHSTWNRAVSIFPRSTFMARVSFIASQEEVRRDKTTRTFNKWFSAYAKMHKISFVGLDHRRYEDVEIGKRYIGDQRCWIIPYVDGGTLRLPQRRQTLTFNQAAEADGDLISNELSLSGPHFEVLDWTSSTTRAGSYVRIAEPEIWSHWSNIRFSTYHEQDN